MKKGFFVLLALLAIISLKPTASESQAAKSFEVGDYVRIVLPPPTSEFAEVGDYKRERFKVLVPAEYRLISAFLLSSDIQHMNKQEPPLMSRYAMVEVDRQAENADFSTKDFADFVIDAKKSTGNIDKTSKDTEEMLNQKLKSLDTQSIQIGKPVQLGEFFSKDDAYGLGVLTAVRQGSNTVNRCGGYIILRVKNRPLCMYLYAEYKDEGTIKWLRDTMESWADNTLKANR